MRLIALALLVACGGGDPANRPIEAGEYQFYTLAADDACLDGALEALFMPAGRETPHPFEFPIYLPAPADAPLSYDVSFRAPFVGMPVTVEADGDGLAIRDSRIEAVVLDAERYGDCAVTFVVDVDLRPAGEGLVAGEGRIDMSAPRGEDGRCPPFEADPCRVTLTVEASHLGPGAPPAR